MNDTSREIKLHAAFITLADTLVCGYDIISLLDTLLRECTRILDFDGGGLLLREPAGGRVSLVASTSEQADFVKIFQRNAEDGPGAECSTTGMPITVADIDQHHARWPAFSAAMQKNGYLSVQATPLRLRTETIGAMNLFCTRPGALNPRDAAAAQALADVATIGILQQRCIHDSTTVTEQLRFALDSRILIEQAKGMLSHAASINMDQAFTALRTYARSHQLPLQAVAESVVERTLTIDGSLRVDERAAVV